MFITCRELSLIHAVACIKWRPPLHKWPVEQCASGQTSLPSVYTRLVIDNLRAHRFCMSVLKFPSGQNFMETLRNIFGEETPGPNLLVAYDESAKHLLAYQLKPISTKVITYSELFHLLTEQYRKENNISDQIFGCERVISEPELLISIHNALEGLQWPLQDRCRIKRIVAQILNDSWNSKMPGCLQDKEIDRVISFISKSFEIDQLITKEQHAKRVMDYLTGLFIARNYSCLEYKNISAIMHPSLKEGAIQFLSHLHTYHSTSPNSGAIWLYGMTRSNYSKRSKDPKSFVRSSFLQDVGMVLDRGADGLVAQCAGVNGPKPPLEAQRYGNEAMEMEDLYQAIASNVGQGPIHVVASNVRHLRHSLLHRLPKDLINFELNVISSKVDCDSENMAIGKLFFSIYEVIAWLQNNTGTNPFYELSAVIKHQYSTFHSKYAMELHWFESRYVARNPFLSLEIAIRKASLDIENDILDETKINESSCKKRFLEDLLNLWLRILEVREFIKNNQLLSCIVEMHLGLLNLICNKDSASLSAAILDFTTSAQNDFVGSDTYQDILRFFLLRWESVGDKGYKIPSLSPIAINLFSSIERLPFLDNSLGRIIIQDKVLISYKGADTLKTLMAELLTSCQKIIFFYNSMATCSTILQEILFLCTKDGVSVRKVAPLQRQTIKIRTLFSPEVPLECRPTHYSVADLERALNNPYCFYVDKVLKLRSLRPEPECWQGHFGNVVHKTLRLLQNGSSLSTDEYIDEFHAHSAQVLSSMGLSEHCIIALWQRNLSNIATWFSDYELSLSLNKQKICSQYVVEEELPEKRGYVKEFVYPAIGNSPHPVKLVLEATPDAFLIDEYNDLHSVIEYKTGNLPSAKEIQSLEKPQLPGLLLALNKTDTIRCLQLNGRGAGCQEKVIRFDMEAAEKAFREALHNAYNAPYILMRDFWSRDYAHLARAVNLFRYNEK